MHNPTPLLDLAARITVHATALHNYLQENNLPQPGFTAASPLDFPVPADNHELQGHRASLVEATQELHDLTVGAKELLNWRAMTNKYDSAALRSIVNMRVASHIPLEGSIPVTELVTKLPSPIHPDTLTRMLRFLATSHIFTEPTPFHFAHTSFSVALRDANVHCNLAHNLNDGFVSAAKLQEALAKWPRSDEPTETAFQVAMETEKAYWEFIAQEGMEQRREEFHGSMRAWTSGSACAAEHALRGGMKWEELPEGALVVDLGGSSGHVSSAIARANPHLRFLVQDLPDVIAANPPLPADVADRISFAPHSFMDPETVQADVYFFRWIMHDWADSYCIKILRNLIPALKKGAKVVIMDAVLPEKGEAPRYVEKLQRGVDLQMLTLLNARERGREDWKKLFRETDERFEIRSVVTPPGSGLGVIEIVWNGE